MAKNPFEILGLTPDILRGLSDDQMKQLVRSMYRQLQLIYHPDASKKDSDKRSIEFSDAYRLVGPDSDPKNFLFFKQEFFKKSPSKEKIGALEDELTSLQGKVNSMGMEYYERFWEFFSLASGLEQSQGINVFNIRNISLALQDYIRGQNQTIIESIDRENTFFQLIIDDNGLIYRREDKSNSNIALRNKRLIGTISEKEVRAQGSMSQVIKKMTGQNFSTIYGIEAVNISRAFNHLPGRGRSNSGGQAVEEMINYIGFESFFGMCRMLSPKVEAGSYLFAANKNGEKIHFTLEGKIVAIDNRNE